MQDLYTNFLEKFIIDVGLFIPTELSDRSLNFLVIKYPDTLYFLVQRFVFSVYTYVLELSRGCVSTADNPPFRYQKFLLQVTV